jgi:hypothetical protein
MSIYDYRDKAAYSHNFQVYKNLAYDLWWSTLHDELIIKLMKNYRWNWYWKFVDHLPEVTNPKILSHLQSQINSRNNIMYYAITRSSELELTKHIHPPATKSCLLCDNSFIEDSLPMPLMERLGAYNLDYCAPCLSNIVFQNSGNSKLKKTEMIQFITELTAALEHIPPQNFGERMDDLISMTKEKRTDVLKVLTKKPTYNCVKKKFGSWLKALIESGILIDGTRETSRGTHTFALDGHLCLSLGEKTIDDYLHRNAIPHEREVYYPDTNYRADFVVGGVFIEYFGLAGNADYDTKILVKKRLCELHKIKLIEIYPKDLISSNGLSKKLEFLIKVSV